MLQNILQEERKKVGLTQQEVADQLHVSRQTISSWETGKSVPDIDALQRLGKFYDISLDQLIKGEQPIASSVSVAPTRDKQSFWAVTIGAGMILGALLGYIVKPGTVPMGFWLVGSILGDGLFFYGFRQGRLPRQLLWLLFGQLLLVLIVGGSLNRFSSFFPIIITCICGGYWGRRVEAEYHEERSV